MKHLVLLAIAITILSCNSNHSPVTQGTSGTSNGVNNTTAEVKKEEVKEVPKLPKSTLGAIMELNNRQNYRCWFTKKYAVRGSDYVTTYEIYTDEALTRKRYTVRSIHVPQQLTVKIEVEDPKEAEIFRVIRTEDYEYEKYTLRPFGRRGGFAMLYGENAPWQFLVFFASRDYTYVDIMDTCAMASGDQTYTFLALDRDAGNEAFLKSKDEDADEPSE